MQVILFFRPPGFSPYMERDEKESSGTGLMETHAQGSSLALSEKTSSTHAFLAFAFDV